MKKQLIILLVTCLLFVVITALIPFWALTVNHHINYDSDGTTYSITQLKNNDVYVEFDEKVVCFQAPCPPVRTKIKLAFSRKNMRIVNRFINSLFNNPKEKKISLTSNDLTEDQLIIMDGIIHNNQDAISKTIDLGNNYTIVTDNKWLTMLNDGGSNISIYYEINLDNKTVVKIKEHYRANIEGTPSTTKMVEYTKTIDNVLMYDIKNTIDDVLKSDYSNGDRSNHPYIIISDNTAEEVYATEAINNLKTLINRIESSK